MDFPLAAPDKLCTFARISSTLLRQICLSYLCYRIVAV
jgi:hypothetical protein